MKNAGTLIVGIVLAGVAAFAVFMAIAYGSSALGIELPDDPRQIGLIGLIALALIFKFAIGQSWGDAAVSAFFSAMAMVGLLYVVTLFVG